MITYFGYGSLVNRETRPPGETALPARLHYWQRAWSHRVESTGVRTACSSLTVERSAIEGEAVDGVIVTIAKQDLAALDEREVGYQRLMLPVESFELPAGCEVSEVAVYVSKTPYYARANNQYPILQSYIDCVLSGYLNVFGDAGLRHFFSTTRGWDGTIENDRVSPRYPRAVQLDKSVLQHFDALLALHGQ